MRKGHVDDCAGIGGSTIDGMRKGHVDDCAGIGVLLNAQYAFAQYALHIGTVRICLLLHVLLSRNLILYPCFYCLMITCIVVKLLSTIY